MILSHESGKKLTITKSQRQVREVGEGCLLTSDEFSVGAHGAIKNCADVVM